MSQSTKYSKPDGWITRAYNYALHLTPFQEQVILEDQKKLRKVWNALVAKMRQAEREWDHGNRGGVIASLKKILNEKGVEGRASEAFNKIAKERGISFDEAKKLKRADMLRKIADIVVSKTGHKLIRISKTRLSAEYAKEYVSSKREAFGVSKATSFWAIISKFDDCAKRVVKGEFGNLRFKRFSDSISQGSQINPNRPTSIGLVSDLTRLIGHQCMKRCNVILHRPLPDGAIIKHMTLSGREKKWTLTVQFDCPRSSVLKPFEQTGRAIGIDPGVKTAFTIANFDGTAEEITPVSSKSNVLKARYEKMSRKLDRQTRANNPECFNENGTWKRGKGVYHVSRQMKHTVQKMREIQEYFHNFRKDYYNKTAFDLLSRFDEIYIGNWNPDRTRKVGEGRKGRNLNRKLGEHSLSTFKGLLKDKASLSPVSKTVLEVSEAYTTVTCPYCQQKTGPTGEKGLDIREWICYACGMIVKRDVGGALNTLYVGISLKREQERKDTPILGQSTKMASTVTRS